jgi:hypothetical protein
VTSDGTVRYPVVVKGPLRTRPLSKVLTDRVGTSHGGGKTPTGQTTGRTGGPLCLTDSESESE